jgi:hypothetical protein
MFERLRQMTTDKQPYRCHECGWRKWREVRVHDDGQDVHPEDLRTGHAPQPVSSADLDQLDSPPTR